jgi:hypothetical protein
MKLKLFNEEAICHGDEFASEGKRAPKVEFRVVIQFDDEQGREWLIDKVMTATPRLKKEENP